MPFVNTGGVDPPASPHKNGLFTYPSTLVEFNCRRHMVCRNPLAHTLLYHNLTQLEDLLRYDFLSYSAMGRIGDMQCLLYV